VKDGERLELGNVELEVLHIPGHTPEHLGLLVTDRTRGAEPWLVFTGHTLMVGDMGRTELATNAEDGARALFRSALRLRALPDYLQVLPGAFAGSVCGRALSATPMSTIGFERRFNKTFAIGDEEAFVAAMVRDIPPAPPNATATRAANLRHTPQTV
jgi:hydroxyacylglutathione hydrolase